MKKKNDLLTKDWSKVFKSVNYNDAVESLAYLVDSCSECDGEFVGGQVKAFLDKAHVLMESSK